MIQEYIFERREMNSLINTAAIGCLVSILGACASMTPPSNPQGVHGMIAVKSVHSAKVTMDKYEEAVKAASMNIFARVDHAAGAQRIGKTLRPTEVLIWGSPPGGTPMMECAQTAGIDLPQKALVWQDAKGDVYLGWNDAAHLVNVRHNTPGCDAVTANVGKALAGFAKKATE
jgi:uncharacterized protein (DUF302 family)